MKERQAKNVPDCLNQTKGKQTKPPSSTSLEKQKRSLARIKGQRGNRN